MPVFGPDEAYAPESVPSPPEDWLGASLTRLTWSRASVRLSKRRLLGLLLLYVAYVASAEFADKIATVGLVTPVWPAAGISIIGLYLLGAPAAPVIFLADLTANKLGGPAPFALTVALGTAGANLLEALVAVALLRALRFDMRLRRARDVGALTAACGAGALAGASVGCTVLLIAHSVSLDGGLSASVVHAWRAWWPGDIVGDIALVSLFGVWSARPDWHGHGPEIALGLALLAAVAVLSFSARVDALYLLFPFLIWAPMRAGRHGATGAAALLAVASVTQTAHHIGPFGQADELGGIVSLQLFLGVLVLCELLFAVLRYEQLNVRASREALTGELAQYAFDELAEAICAAEAISGALRQGATVAASEFRVLRGQLGCIELGLRVVIGALRVGGGSPAQGGELSAILRTLTDELARHCRSFEISASDELPEDLHAGPLAALTFTYALRKMLRVAVLHSPSAVRAHAFSERGTLRLHVSDDGREPDCAEALGAFSLARARARALGGGLERGACPTGTSTVFSLSRRRLRR